MKNYKSALYCHIIKGVEGRYSEAMCPTETGYEALYGYAYAHEERDLRGEI